jgi:hypothetical protein
MHDRPKTTRLLAGLLDRIEASGYEIGLLAAENPATARHDIAPMVTYLLSDAAQMVTGSVIDFDQTVHGPYGEHVPPASGA